MLKTYIVSLIETIVVDSSPALWISQSSEKTTVMLLVFSLVMFELCCRAADTLISDKDLAVRAAAASIYSTCNFLASEDF
ncbi:hypothetical protein Bca101_024636 [Brassica carinata]